MKLNLVRSLVIFLSAVSIAGCSVVRLVETRAGIGVTKATKTETRQTTKLVRKDIQMTFDATGNELELRLYHQPYYESEKREVTKYTPEVSILDASISFVELIACILTLANAEPWQTAVFLGGPIDALLYSFTFGISKTEHAPWQSLDRPGSPEWIVGQPYRIELPRYSLGNDYLTQSGNKRISLFELASGTPKADIPISVEWQSRKMPPIDVQASTTIDGKNYQKTVTISDQEVLRNFHNLTLGIDMVSKGKPLLIPRAEVSARWFESELQAGKTARLRVAVRNTGKGELYRFISKTVSSNQAFNNREMEFGKINPGESVTLDLSFKTDDLMRTQDIPIHISFEECNGNICPGIDMSLHIVGKPRPKFDYAYRILDGGTPNSMGNSDGIIQQGESVDLVLTIRNTGPGIAETVTATLDTATDTGVAVLSDSSVKIKYIRPGDSRNVTFSITVKPDASIGLLPLDLSITEGRFGAVTLTDSINLPIEQKIPSKIIIVDLDGIITVGLADVHDSADHETRIIGSIPQNSRVKITGQLDDWYRIEIGELTGWVNTQQLAPQEIIAPVSSQFSEPAVIEVVHRRSPKLTLVSPKSNAATVNTETIDLIVVATDDYGIEKIELAVNGELVKGRSVRIRSRQEKDAPQTNITIHETIPLSYGKNQIKLVAFDTDDQSSEPIIINVTRTREMGELWVLSIGISDYQNVSKLNYADDDAKAIADYFRDIGVPDDHITLLCDKDATVDAIRQAFGELMGNAKESSSVVVYFSGHGAPSSSPVSLDADGIDKYLLTCESDPDNLYGTAFPMDQIAGIFKRLASDRVVFIADTCYSGAAGGKTILASNMAGSRATFNYEGFLSRLVEGKGRIILTASSGDEISQESPELKHGFFTYCLLKALRGSADKNKDGFITISETYDYVVREVPKLVDQHPMQKGEMAGDVVIGRVK